MPHDDANKPNSGPGHGPSTSQGPEASGNEPWPPSGVDPREHESDEPEHHSEEAETGSADIRADQPRRRRAVERALLEFLVCPERKTTLIYDPARDELISPTADLAYPIQDGVPILLEACARKLDDEDRRRHRIKI